MHLVCLCEALPDTYPKFVKWFQGHNRGHGSPIVRELKILDINMKEQDANYWATLLHRNISFYEDYSRHDLPNERLEKLAKWIRRLTPLEPHNLKIDPEIEKNLSKSFKQVLGDWVYMYPLGKLPDKKDGSGLEMI